MNILKSILYKYKAAAFYISVLIISGALIVLQAHIPKADEYSLSLPQLAPAFSVLIICLLTDDKGTLWRICKSVPLTVKDIAWIPIILAITILAVTMTAGILSWLGTPYQKWDGTVFNIFIMAGGCFFEEAGWRGFLLPQLKKGHSTLISTIIVGLLWGAWHMSFNLGIVGFLIFIVTAIEMSLLMTWIYSRTNGNLLLMTLWHVSINVLNQILLTGRLTAFGFLIFAIVLGFFCSIVLIKNQQLYSN